MAYDGMYGDLSTRGTSNEILTQVLEVKNTVLLSEANVVTLEANTVSNTALSAGSANISSNAAGNAANSASIALTAQSAAEVARTAAQAAAQAAQDGSGLAALTLANTAITTSNNAVSTANAASSNASAAVITANASGVTAGNAVTTANAANVTAGNALTTANSANTRNTDAITEGTTNLYFTQNRVRASLLTSISFVTNAAVLAADTILQAIGKLQAQITDRFTKAEVNSLAGTVGVGRSRNLIDNADLTISQRNIFSLSSAVTGTYFLDRWKSLTTSGTTSALVSTNASPTGDKVLIISAGQVAQVIDITSFIGGTYTLSTQGTAGITLQRNSVTIANCAGNSQTTVSIDAVGLTSLVIFVGTGTLYKPQLELGSTSTPFYRVSYAENVRQCQRFFARVQKIGWNGVGAINNVTWSQQYKWPIVMVSTPNLSSITAGVIQTNMTGYSIDGAGTEGFRVILISGYSGTAASMDFSTSDYVQGSCEP